MYLDNLRGFVNILCLQTKLVEIKNFGHCQSFPKNVDQQSNYVDVAKIDNDYEKLDFDWLGIFHLKALEDYKVSAQCTMSRDAVTALHSSDTFEW